MELVHMKRSLVQSLSRVLLFATPWTTAHQASLSITNSWSLPNLMSIELVMPSNHLIFCHPLLLLPSIFPSIRVFSSTQLCIRGPKYWSFKFSSSPSNEYSGLISFRIDLFDLHAVQGTLKSLLQHQNSKMSILWRLACIMVELSHPYMITGKTIALTRCTFVVKWCHRNQYLLLIKPNAARTASSLIKRHLHCRRKTLQQCHRKGGLTLSPHTYTVFIIWHWKAAHGGCSLTVRETLLWVLQTASYFQKCLQWICFLLSECVLSQTVLLPLKCHNRACEPQVSTYIKKLLAMFSAAQHSWHFSRLLERAVGIQWVSSSLHDRFDYIDEPPVYFPEVRAWWEVNTSVLNFRLPASDLPVWIIKHPTLCPLEKARFRVCYLEFLARGLCWLCAWHLFAESLTASLAGSFHLPQWRWKQPSRSLWPVTACPPQWRQLD